MKLNLLTKVKGFSVLHKRDGDKNEVGSDHTGESKPVIDIGGQSTVFPIVVIAGAEE